MVAMSVFLRWPVTLPKKFFTKCRNVTPRPSAIAGRNICWLRLPGRLTTFTPMAIRVLLAAPRLNEQQDQRRDHDVGDRDREKALPAEAEQLIRAEARQRPPDQELEHAEREDLDAPQNDGQERKDQTLRDEPDVRCVGCQEAVDGRAPVPAAEEQRDHDRARRDDFQELAQEEQPEAHAGVLDEVADDLGLALRDVERRPLGLGDRGGQEQQERERLEKDAPVRSVVRETEDLR